jgi:acetolactate synthase-1/2/3 large subunit
MSCGELATLSRLALPVVVVCFSNGTHGTVDLGCKKLFPDSPIPKMSLSLALDIVGVARAMGVAGERFTTALHLEECLADALAAGRPYVIELVIDPEVEAPIGQRLNSLSNQFRGRADVTQGERYGSVR